MRPVHSSVDDLLAGATEREAFTPPDGKSETLMERVVIDGDRYVVKYLDHRHDWIMRATGDLTARPIEVWRLGLLDEIPDSIDSTMVGAAWDGRAGAILMRDVGEWLLPEGDAEIPVDQHLRFLDHMAEFHAAFWGWRDDVGLAPLSNRYVCFHHRLLPETEAAIGGSAAVPTKFVPEGWARLPERSPTVAELVFRLHDNIDALIEALTRTPSTFIQGDWKAGNLGSHPDGRTILLDWAVPGEAPPCSEILWYLCLNRARIPHSKEDAIAAFRSALERHGVDTAPWWDRQLGLCHLGEMVLFGWEKALGDDEELEWWCERAIQGARYLVE